ncbi:diguanylate cyclase, partial [bacterium]
PFYGLSIRSDYVAAGAVIARMDAFLKIQVNDPVAVQAKLAYLETLLANSPYGSIAFGRDGQVLSANARALELLGYTQFIELEPIPFIEFFAPDDRIQVSQLLFGDQDPGQSRPPVECRLLNFTGFSVPVEMRASWMDLPEPYGRQLICHFNDITHHYEVEQALRASEQRYRFLVEFQGEGVVMVDAKSQIDYINAAGAILIGGTPDTIIGQPLATFIPESQMQRLQGQLENRRKGVSTSYELTVQTLNDIQRDVLVTATPRYTAEGNYNGTLAIFRDITERKQLEERLRYQSTHDTMTSLFNRAFFDEAIENYDPRVSPPASIIIVDVDGLKEVNDQDGHKAGDRLIQKVAKILIESFRVKDIIARIGGDEFAILLYDTDEVQLHQAIIRLRRNLEEANANLPLEQQVSFSIGGATAGLTRELSQALMVADMRMYRQKRRKKASHGSQLME